MSETNNVCYIDSNEDIHTRKYTSHMSYVSGPVLLESFKEKIKFV